IQNVFFDPNNPVATLGGIIPNGAFTGQQGFLTSLAVDWRFATPDNPSGPANTPVLYVGGNAGIFRSRNQGQKWTRFPNVTDDGAPTDGGYLPNSIVSSLSLALGNIISASGQPVQNTGYNLLV